MEDDNDHSSIHYSAFPNINIFVIIASAFYSILLIF